MKDKMLTEDLKIDENLKNPDKKREINVELSLNKSDETFENVESVKKDNTELLKS
jgi:hypothetical protein